MALKGDFSGLGLLVANLNKLAEVPSQASKQVATELTQELQLQFADGKDPYGKLWAPLKPSTLKKGRHPPPLTDKGALKSGTRAIAMQGVGVQIELGEAYGFFHQKGTIKMVARRILPAGGMPKTWSVIIKNATQAAILRRLGK
jgi:hypothetical protein